MIRLLILLLFLITAKSADVQIGLLLGALVYWFGR